MNELQNIDTSGFYQQFPPMRAGKFVYGPGFTLLREDKDTYAYPVVGWTWFDSVFDAATAYNIPVEEFNLDLPPTQQ